MARRLAENPDVSVLLLEAGGPDDVPEVMRPQQWPLNLGGATGIEKLRSQHIECFPAWTLLPRLRSCSKTSGWALTLVG